MQLQLGGIACRRLYTPFYLLDNVLVLFEGAKISMLGEFASSHLEPDFYNAQDDDLFVVPGFVDVHIHGCGGADFLDKTTASLQTISSNSARGGATSLLATTTIPVDDEELEGFAEFVRLLKEVKVAGARFVGIHLEGPFINPNRSGAFGPRYIQPANLKHAERILSISEDVLAKITIAPEIENGDALIRLFAENPRTSIEVSVGHSELTFEQANRWFEHERVRQVTHAFNAMHSFHHRRPGLLGAALLNDKVWAEMIPDGHHLSGAAIELLHRVKGRDRLMIVTDASAATGTPPGTMIESIGGLTQVKDGAVRLMNGALAGSNVLMNDAMFGAINLGKVPLEDAIRMSCVTPAQSVHLFDRIGSIEPGKQADLCIMRRDGSVVATIRDGILVYEAARN
jgi:N-acetylglucosamine-6-phosphate deacetylase